MTLGQQMYKVWKEQHKINLRVYTDEQMFEIGFDAGRQAGILEEKEKSATAKLPKNKKA